MTQGTTLRVTFLGVCVLLCCVSGCAVQRGVDFAGIARQSTSTLSDITSLEGRIMQASMPMEQQTAALDRAGRIRAMVLAVDLALVMAAGESYTPATSAKINAAADTAHRHLGSFVNRPADLFARSATASNEWNAFEAEADTLLDNLQQQLAR